MLLNNNWGTITWNMLHTLVEKSQNEKFYNYKIDLISIIQNICVLLPCQTSCKLSKIFLDNVFINKIDNLNDVKKILYVFHNYINKNNKKQLFNYNNIIKYKDFDIHNIYNSYANLYLNVIFKKGTLNNHKMIILVNYIYKFIIQNIQKEEICESININQFDVTKEIVVQEDIIQENMEQDATIQEIAVQEDSIQENMEQDATIQENNTTNIILKDILRCKHSKNYFNKPISLIDDNNLPSLEKMLSEAMLEIMKNPKCVPYDVYVRRWKEVKNNDNIKKKITIKALPTVDDSLLPSLDLTFQKALDIIKANQKCVPFDLYIKRWNKIKLVAKHKKQFS